MKSVHKLREAHAHIAQHGREMGQLNLSDCTSRAECLEQVAAEAARLDAAGEPGWLLANSVRVEGWMNSKGGAMWPTLPELDRACPKRPSMIGSFDHHACAVNSAAMTAAGFGPASADPEGGRIVRNSAGEATGLLLEAAFGTMRRAVPTPSREQLRRFVKAAADDLAVHGFAEVHDLLSPPWLGATLGELDRAGELAVSVWVYPTLEDVPEVAAGRERWQTARVRLAGAKVFADGTLNSRTAWMLEPYADPLPGMERGQAMQTPRQLREAMSLTDSLGLGLAVHAIGDGAVRAVLDAWEEHILQNRGRKGTESSDHLRHPSQPEYSKGPFPDARSSVPPLRIEHAEVVDEADVARFAKLGVVCSVQPCHLLYDVEALSHGLPHRLDRVLPLRDLIRSGCRPGELLWFGSDAPIVRPHPEDSIQAAVHRRRVGMDQGHAIAPTQALTEAEAWAAFGGVESNPQLVPQAR